MLSVGRCRHAGAELHRTLSIDPWLLRHLVLSIDDRSRAPRDAAGLDRAISWALDELVPDEPHAPFGPPVGAALGPAIVMGLPLWAFETNAWVLAPRGAGHSCVLIDVPPDVRPLLVALDRLRLRVSAVFLTHAHLDHTGGVGELLETLDVDGPVFVHRDDVAQVMEPIGVDRLMARAHGVRRPPAGAFVSVVDGQRVIAAGVEMRVMHAPGHTPGTTCWLAKLAPRPLLFTGDQMFANGWGRCDLAGGCAETMDASMASRILTLEDDLIVLPGHGRASTLGDARRACGLVAAPGV